MLTRLKVKGFKNLVDVDVRFGPFTCIAGANGAGKSNLFDAIRFLSALADQPLNEAALSVRDSGSHNGNVRDLFQRSGQTVTERMSFEVEMIVPTEGVDDLGQTVTPSTTLLRYSLTLSYRHGEQARTMRGLELISEELSEIIPDTINQHLIFPYSRPWRRSAVRSGNRKGIPFISTSFDGQQRYIQTHSEYEPFNTSRRLIAGTLLRTTLSAPSPTENPTIFIAKREMQSWQTIQLEPSKIRQPDTFASPGNISSDGSHIPATIEALYSLKTKHLSDPLDAAMIDLGDIDAQIANRLSQIDEDIRDIHVSLDEQQELLTLSVSSHDGTIYPAYLLSDGTLRFLALSVLEIDPHHRGIICLEEPENGIHPSRIPAILRLLQDIAVDTRFPVGEDNLLRQVVINTHSPVVVQQVPDDSLILIYESSFIRNKQRVNGALFASLPETWRSKDSQFPTISKGKILTYLNPTVLERNDEDHFLPEKRVVDRDDIRSLLT